MTTQTKLAAKKPYKPPKFYVYGNLAELTKANSLAGNSDNGQSPPTTRTGGA